MNSQDFYEDKIKLYSEVADVYIYYTVELYNELKSWKPITGVRLEHVEQFIEDIQFNAFEAIEYHDADTTTVVGTDEEYFLKRYPQFSQPWATFKHNLLKGVA